MKFYWIKTRWFIRWIFRSFIWKLPANGNCVYLTFDDGPTPEVTPWVLDELDKYNAKATFFCIGDRIDKSPDLFKRLIDDGHSIGNHSYSHLNAWHVDAEAYLEDIEKCQESILKLHPQGTNLLRPPYGKLRRSQTLKLRKRFRIMMWDVLSADFDLRITPEKCTENVLRNVRPGSIVIFHDSVKSYPNMEKALPATLEFIHKKGWKCVAIPQY